MCVGSLVYHMYPETYHYKEKINEKPSSFQI